MRDTIKVTPTLIRRIRAAEDRIEMASVPTKDGEGRALLVFMNEAQAEAFRSETGAYPASEGFVAQATFLDGLRAILDAWKYTRVALRGPEPEAVREFDADEFIAMLELGEMAAEDGLLDNVRPFPQPPPDVAPLLEKNKGSRTQKLGRVAIALETAHASAAEAGEVDYAHYIESELAPFIEAEQERAAVEEELTPLLEWENSLLRKA
jgi:hypothetical protein